MRSRWTDWYGAGTGSLDPVPVRWKWEHRYFPAAPWAGCYVPTAGGVRVSQVRKDAYFKAPETRVPRQETLALSTWVTRFGSRAHAFARVWGASGSPSLPAVGPCFVFGLALETNALFNSGAR